MAYVAEFGYHPPSSDSAFDSKLPAYLDADSSAALDPSLLDTDIMQSPTANDSFRKDSFANSNGVLSPAESQVTAPWDHQYTTVSAAASASNAFIHHDDGQLYMRQSQNQGPAPFAQHHHPQTWALDHGGSGTCTPTTQGIDFMPPPGAFEPIPHYVHGRQDSAHGSFSHAVPTHFNGTQQPLEPAFIPAPQVQTPMSPHSHQDWMGMAQQELEGRPSSKRMRQSSPQRTVVDLQRRDGIRKKNGRIDIPQERNIATIDELIERTTDEDTLKELKQQKRLLRNREAALASRQRKKKHTEDLEVKEKSYTQQIAMLESQVHELTREREARERERQIMHQRIAEAQCIIDTMQDEKRELAMRHNEEASQLRRKVHILSDQLDAGPAPAMSAAPSSTGFTDFNAEMEALNMGPHDWDNFIFVNDLQNGNNDDFTFETKPEQLKTSQSAEKKASPTSVADTKRGVDATNEQPIASGLLFMLLLCGAWIASKPASSQPSDFPKMPAEVQAAAPTILNSLLSESGGLATQDNSHTMARVGAQQEPIASGLPFANGKSNSNSRLDHMHRTLTSPTKQQEIDQAFSLTQAQYASMTNMDYPAYTQPPPNTNEAAEPQPPQRRVLAEALANLEQQDRSASSHGKAEVYTRSLLWDQIPADVVRQFREMVREKDEVEARQHQGKPQQKKRRQTTKVEA